MKALVTGGGGFVGRALCKQLRARDDEVIALQRRPAPALDALGVTCIAGDIAEPGVVLDAAAGCDVVFHVAAKVSAAGKRADFERVNILGTDNVIEACRTVGAALVYCSTPSVVHSEGDVRDADESAPYAQRFLAEYPRTKAIAEQRVLGAKDLATVALRPHLVFGPEDDSLLPRLIGRAKIGRLPIVGDGKNIVDWTYVDNVAHAHVCAYEALQENPDACRGKPYFITNGQPVNPWTWFNGVLEAIGLPTIERRVSFGVARTAGKVFDFSWRTFGLRGEPPMTEFGAVQVATTHTFSIKNAKRDLGYAPIVGMDEGTRRTIAWAKDALERGEL